MALVLVLAARWRIVDRILSGPDKAYGSHRWLGFSVIGGGLAHWALASPVGLSILPEFAGRGSTAGLVAIIGLSVMALVAMLRMIPYHIWKASHTLMGPLFLLSTFHTFLSPARWPWALPLGIDGGCFNRGCHRMVPDVAG